MKRNHRPAVPATESRRKRRLREAAAFSLLRGLAYGLGTGMAGLVLFWFQQSL
ncbi:hypothetical protein ACPCAG_33120 [Streptomyces pseudogriseolus]|uniref:hypothetical protein n=1 Tax=Streptomyces pseudogriseolus TaxID=36817 RepID=UPI003FA2FAC5